MFEQAIKFTCVFLSKNTVVSTWISGDLQIITQKNKHTSMNDTDFHNFNEAEWIRLLFMISGTQLWIEEMEKRIIYLVSFEEKKKLFKSAYYLSASACAHILEKHYYRIPKHPESSKFTIPIHEILHYIREAGYITPRNISGSLNYERIMEVDRPIGFNINGELTCIITIITDASGYIKSAFPGRRYTAYETMQTQIP